MGQANTETPSGTGVPLNLACAGCTLNGALILIDENMNAAGLVQSLRDMGFNVVTMRQVGLPVGTGFPDKSIIEWLKANRAYVLTRNVKDFKNAYDLVIGAKDGWSVQQTVGRMGELKRQFEANPQSAQWTRYISLMEAGRFVPPNLLRVPFFFMLDIRDEFGCPIWRLDGCQDFTA